MLEFGLILTPSRGPQGGGLPAHLRPGHYSARAEPRPTAPRPAPSHLARVRGAPRGPGRGRSGSGSHAGPAAAGLDSCPPTESRAKRSRRAGSSDGGARREPVSAVPGSMDANAPAFEGSRHVGNRTRFFFLFMSRAERGGPRYACALLPP